jgi:hypothetical protein
LLLGLVGLGFRRRVLGARTALGKQLDGIDLKVCVSEVVGVICDPRVAGRLAGCCGAFGVPVVAAGPGAAEGEVDDLYIMLGMCSWEKVHSYGADLQQTAW